MTKNKLCCRIYPIVLIAIATILSLSIWYFEEGIRNFEFLKNDEIFNFLGTTLFIALIPIGIYYWLKDKEKYESKARGLALLGFLPALILLIWILI